MVSQDVLAELASFNLRSVGDLLGADAEASLAGIIKSRRGSQEMNSFEERGVVFLDHEPKGQEKEQLEARRKAASANATGPAPARPTRPLHRVGPGPPPTTLIIWRPAMRRQGRSHGPTARP